MTIKSEETASFDERGCHTKYEASRGEPRAANDVLARTDALRSNPPANAPVPRSRFRSSTPTLSPPAFGSAPIPKAIWQIPCTRIEDRCHPPDASSVIFGNSPDPGKQRVQ